MLNYYLGIDMGGTQIKIAVVTDNVKIIEETVMDTDIKAKPVTVIKNIVTKLNTLKNYSKIKSIGVGIAGDIDSVKGIVRFSPNLPKWKNVYLKKELEKLTKRKVFIDNDANTSAIGAFWLDLKGKATNMVCVALGTGVGGGIIINKKLYRGATGTAGEIGHITVESNGNKCNCGNNGCIETYIGVKHLVKSATELMKKHKSDTILKLADNNKNKITPKILSQACAKNDYVAKQVWKQAGEKLGILLTTILNFINPDHIVICGGISKADKLFFETAYKEINKRAFKTAAKSCRIIISKYTSKLGVAGSAMLVKN